MSLIPPSAPGAAQKDFRPRLAWATGLVVLTFLVLAGRLYQLQILQGDEYKEKAEENFVKEIRMPADRGTSWIATTSSSSTPAPRTT